MISVCSLYRGGLRGHGVLIDWKRSTCAGCFRMSSLNRPTGSIWRRCMVSEKMVIVLTMSWVSITLALHELFWIPSSLLMSHIMMLRSKSVPAVVIHHLLKR